MTKETVKIEVPADAKITINGETWTPPKTNGLPVPTEDNKGWFLDVTGRTSNGNGQSVAFLKYVAAQGNWFPTKEQSELASRQRATTRLLDEISAKDGFIDWSDGKLAKYSINPDNNNNKELHIDGWRYTRFLGTTYFLTEERAQEAIDTLGEDAIKELFLNPNQMQD